MIAYVYRETGFEDYGERHGGATARKFLCESLGLEPVPIRIQNPSVVKVPEALDFEAHPVLAAIDWSKYSYVISNEWGFASFFAMREIPFCQMVLFLWNYDDGIAHWIEKFAPFADTLACPTLESYGFLSASRPDARYLPTPVDPACFVPRTKEPFVVWVGRDDKQKDMTFLREVALLLPNVEFRVFSGGPLAGPGHALARLSNVRMYVQQDRSLCWDAIAKAQVQLMTSEYEVYATTLIEGGLAGCRLVARDVFGVRHCLPYITLRRTPEQVATAVAQALMQPKDHLQRDFFSRMFGTDGDAGNRWRAFLWGEACHVPSRRQG